MITTEWNWQLAWVSVYIWWINVGEKVGSFCRCCSLVAPHRVSETQVVTVVIAHIWMRKLFNVTCSEFVKTSIESFNITSITSPTDRNRASIHWRQYSHYIEGQISIIFMYFPLFMQHFVAAVTYKVCKKPPGIWICIQHMIFFAVGFRHFGWFVVWLSSGAVMVLESQSWGRGLDSHPLRCQVLCWASRSIKI